MCQEVEIDLACRLRAASNPNSHPNRLTFLNCWITVAKP
jgi:hypothetical protein